MRKTRTWVLLIGGLALVLAALSWYTLTRRAPGRIAEVVQDGRVLRTIDLDRVTEAHTFTVECPEGGCNTVLVRPGAICVQEADCPDRICVEQGWLADRASPIVCIPHRLVIRLQGETQGPDAVSG